MPPQIAASKLHRRASARPYLHAVKPIRPRRRKLAARAEPAPDPRAPTPARPVRDWLAHPGRFRLAVCGRRFGKTTLGAMYGRTFLESNPGARAMWLAPTFDQCRAVMATFADWLKPARRRTRRRAWLDRSGRELHFPNRASLIWRSAESGDNLRGPGLDLVIIDESADVPENVWTEVVLPMLTERQGKAILLATPRGKRNWIFGVFQRALHRSSWAVLHEPTKAAAHITPAMLQAIRDEMPEAKFRQEFGAEFLDDGSSAFPGVDSLIHGGAWASNIPGPNACGLDLARVQDWTVATAIDPQSGRVIGFERWQGLPWSVQAARIADFARRFPGSCAVDATGLGDPVFETIRDYWNRSIPVNFAGGRRESLLDALAVAIESKRLQLCDEPQLINELRACSYESRKTDGFTSSRITTQAETDDCVMSLTLAWHARRFAGDAPTSLPWSLA